MNKKEALEKIKKCLRLSKSTNEHEAAQALKHAQALMQQYGLTGDDIGLSDITESLYQCAKSLPKWQHGLINIVTRAFGIEAYIKSGLKSSVVFYGAGPRPDLASYAYEVLLRQIKKDRREFVATALKYVRLPKNRNYRADEFCFGWVMAVSRMVDKFAIPKTESDLLKKYVSDVALKESTVRSSKPSSSAKVAAKNDFYDGYSAGESAQLHHGMSGSKQAELGVCE